MHQSRRPAQRTGRATLVTGASSGIGRATALLLAGDGDHVVLLARRVGLLEVLAAECRLAGATSATVIGVDVTDWPAVVRAVAQIVDKLGGLDVVVHAAGVAAYGEFTEIPPEVFDRVQNTNVLGTANVARAALQVFQDQGHGHLILLGSLLGKVSAPYFSPYVTSKWAVHGLARTLQIEAGLGDIHIGLIEPGGVDTSIYTKAASVLGVQGSPPPPVASPEKVAQAVAHMLQRPQREVYVGVLNPLVVFGFRAFPRVYDRLVVPLMKRLALAKEPVAAHTGNLFDAVSEPAESAETAAPSASRPGSQCPPS